MRSEDKRILGVTGLIVTGFLLFVGTIAGCEMRQQTVLINNGYVQVQKQASTDAMWVKPTCEVSK